MNEQRRNSNPFEAPRLIVATCDDGKEYAERVEKVTSKETLLAEPVFSSPGWFTSVYRRLLAMSSGPTLFGPESGTDLEKRLDIAWVCGAPDRDRWWGSRLDLAHLGNGVGSISPALVLVGEKPGKLGPNRPFLSRSGVWLFRALRSAGHDELTVYATNAYGDRQMPRKMIKQTKPDDERLTKLATAFFTQKPLWIALGSHARRALERLKIEHVAVHHPSWWRRFEYKAGPEAMAAAMLEAGLPEGPWIRRELPHVKVETLPDLPDPFNDVEPVRAERTLVEVRSDDATTVKPTVVTSTPVADEVTVTANAPAVVEEKRAFDEWLERHRKLHAREADPARDADEAVVHAWSAVNTVMSRLAEDVQSKDYQPTPKDAAALARIVDILSKHEKEKAPSPENVVEVYVMLKRQLVDEWGPEVLREIDSEVIKTS